ncbi:MAG TPA: acyloxyacyl hydrolase [Candidatus Acidoferrales bacterium]|nr:acyloxyacyl hydrolase [Candidatus Acidoferrales bacterium]
MTFARAGVRHFLIISVIAAIGAVVPPAALAQDSSQTSAQSTPPPPPVFARHMSEFGAWGSYAVNSPDLYGSRAHGDFGALGFRYGRVLSASRHRVIEYTFDVLPAEVIHEYTYAPCTFQSGGQTISTHCITGYQTVYAGGIAPFGWKFNFLPEHRIQPFAALVGGMIGSVARIPTDVPGGALFNFTAEWQLGFERFNASRDRAWIVGYKLEHISDAFRTSVNPGIDLNVIFVGYSFFR